MSHFYFPDALSLSTVEHPESVQKNTQLGSSPLPALLLFNHGDKAKDEDTNRLYQQGSDNKIIHLDGPD